MSDLLLVSLTLNGLTFAALLVALARREYWRWRVRREVWRARSMRQQWLAEREADHE